MEQANYYHFAGRHAVITGGAAGIGLAIARRLAAGGASLSLWDRDAGQLEAARASLGDAQVQCVLVDVGSEAAVKAARDTTVAAIGQVDILVNSAGITGPNMTVCDYPVEEWDQVMRINLRGPFLTCRSLAPVMRANDYGRIVNIASIAGKEGNPNASAYSASKAGVIALTKSLGKDWAATSRSA